jgi:hypothetical protein
LEPFAKMIVNINIYFSVCIEKLFLFGFSLSNKQNIYKTFF